MTVKAYIAEDDPDLSAESKCHIEYDSSQDNKENTNEDENKTKTELKFIVPGCITGKGCNGCGNCF